MDGLRAMNTTGQIIRDRRIAYGLTQVELGYETGVTGAYISQLEVDQHGPRLAQGVKIAGVLGTDCYALIGAALPVHLTHRQRCFSDRCLLEFFADFPNGAQITLTDLATAIGYDRGTVQRRSQFLAAAGLFKITKYPRVHGIEGANKYEVTPFGRLDLGSCEGS